MVPGQNLLLHYGQILESLVTVRTESTEWRGCTVGERIQETPGRNMCERVWNHTMEAFEEIESGNVFTRRLFSLLNKFVLLLRCFEMDAIVWESHTLEYL